MTLMIEYYEVTTPNGYLYYFMPMDSDAKNKENMDQRSHRIWKFNTRSNRVTEVLNRRDGKPQVTRAEFLKIQYMASPVPYSEYYLRLEEARQLRERLKAKKSDSVD